MWYDEIRLRITSKRNILRKGLIKMSKGARTREASAEKIRARKEKELHEAKVRKIRKTTAIVTSLVILALIVAAVTTSIISNVRLNSGDALRSKTAASSSTVSVDGTMMKYSFDNLYDLYMQYYGDYASYYGITAETVMDDNKEQIESLLALNESAKANGVSLTDDEIAAVKTRSEMIAKGDVGRGVKQPDIYNMELISALAYKYQNIKNNEFAPASEEVAAKFDENPKAYMTADYIYFPISIPSDEDENATLTAEEVYDLADELGDAADKDGFIAVVKKIIEKLNYAETEEEVDSIISSLEKVDVSYTSGDEISEWAFSDIAVGDTRTIIDEDAGTITVYMLTKAPEKDESKTVSVRHILFENENYGSAAKAKAEAEKIYGEFKSGAMTEEAFANLALAYSTDNGSVYNGGLYENVPEGQMVASFNDWIFDETRKAGDTDIVETDFGYHIMYFVGEGSPVWASNVESEITSEKYSSFIAEALLTYPVAFDEEVLSDVIA